MHESLIPTVTAELLIEAAEGINHEKPQLLVDGGVENYNNAIDKLIETGLFRRLLAQTGIAFSNSLIESWWRVLKHQRLYLNTVDSAASVRRLVAFCADQHNSHLPHSAFKGQTPDEMYHGTGNQIPTELEAARVFARQSRLKANQGRSCEVCQQVQSVCC